MIRRILSVSALLLMSLLVSAQSIRVLSNTDLGEGFSPRISADGARIMCLQDESYSYIDAESGTYVTNENCELWLHQNGRKRQLFPHGTQAHYIWASISPNGEMILFNTAKGTGVCDLQGRVLYYLDHLNAPVWYGNEYVVGHCDYSYDGHSFGESSIWIYSLDGSVKQQLTDATEMGMYPSVSTESGRIVYSTLNGRVHMLQTNLTTNPIKRELPTMMVAPKSMLRAPKQMAGKWNTFSDVKIYINPGHGGHASNDRNIVIYPFQSGDPNGFWESNSNLDKGLKLRDWLQGLGMQVMMSRTTNNDGGGNDKSILDGWLQGGRINQAQYDDMLQNGDDRSLSAIVAEANSYGADFMLSIHSNAGAGTANYVLMMYAGKDENDTHYYPTATPVSDESRAISTLIADNLQENTLTNWTTRTATVVGDKTYGRTAMGWSDGYGVLRGLRVPGVISEGSMHDYIPETYRLMNMDYKWKESWQFMKAFCTYFLNYAQTTGVILGQVRDGANKMSFPSFYALRKTHDELLPMNRAVVELCQNNTVLQTYTTDTLYNGIFAFWNVQPGTYQVRTKVDGYYLREDDVTVTANQMEYVHMMLNMERRTRPEVLSYSPQVDLTDSIEVKTPIIFTFNWDMDADKTAAALHISPAVDGEIVFSESQHTMTFTPTTGYEKATEYTVTLDTTACHPDTNFVNTLAAPLTFSFRTKNRTNLVIQQASPANNATDVSLQPTLMFVFDAELAASAGTNCSKLFSLVSDDGSYRFTPSVRNFKKNTAPAPYGSARFELPDELQPNTTYHFTLSKDLSDINGVTLGTDRVYTFTTTQASATEDEGELIMSCDSLAFDVNYDKSSGIASKTLVIEKSRYAEGRASNRLAYKFDATAEEAYIFVVPRNLSWEFTSRDAIGIELYGDLSENEVYLEFSVEGDVHVLPLTTLDYAGWRYQVLPLSDLPANVAYQFTGIRINRGSNILSPSGEIYIDGIRRQQNVVTEIQGIEPQDSNVRYVLQDGILYVQKNGTLYSLTGEVR